MKKCALVGFLGGLLFTIGDLLVYLLPHYLSTGYYQDVANMNMWRLAISTYLGCIGSGFLLIGFYSLYNITKKNCSKLTNRLMLLIVLGIILTPIGHFIIACIKPMTFKIALECGTSIDTAKDIALNWVTYTNPIKFIGMTIIIIFQSVMMVVLILKKKINCPKWMVVLNPLGLTLILSVPLLLLLEGTAFVGIAECFESLGEGAMYLAVYWHYMHTDYI